MPLHRTIIRLGDISKVPRKNDILLIEYIGWIHDPKNAGSGFKGKQWVMLLNSVAWLINSWQVRFICREREASGIHVGPRNCDQR